MTPTTLAADAAQALQGVTDFDALAYRFWSIHPKDIPEPVGMPEGYKGGPRAWFYATEMRAAALTALSAERDALAAQVAEAVKMLDEADRKYNRLTNDMIERHAAQVAELTRERDRLADGKDGWKTSSDEYERLFRNAEAKVAELTLERERLALAICGGEDAPGYANAQTVKTLEKVARDNFRDTMEQVNRTLAAEAKVARLEEALDRLSDLRGAGCGCDPICRCYSADGHRELELEVEEIARAALTEGTPTEYERKVAQMKEDFPNGI